MIILFKNILIQYFDVMSSDRSNRTHKNIEILKKFDSTCRIESNSIRSDLFRMTRKILEFNAYATVETYELQVLRYATANFVL